MKRNRIGGPSGLQRSASVAIGFVVIAFSATASGQSPKTHCAILCSPSVTLMPGMLRTHLFGGPVVQTSKAGERRLPSTTSFEVITAFAAQTAIPRLSAFTSIQWLPNATEARNPFTLYTASELGTSVRANAPTATFGFSASLLPAKQTNGWFDLAVNLGDLFSQAARPHDKSAYTHKLDMDLIGHLNVFDRLSASTYARRVALYGILDYVATGLPQAGDEVPVGRRFVSRARPAALIVGVALPLSPQSP